MTVFDFSLCFCLSPIGPICWSLKPSLLHWPWSWLIALQTDHFTSSPKMDVGGSESLQDVITTEGRHLVGQKRQIQEVATQIQQLTKALSEVITHLAALDTSPSPVLTTFPAVTRHAKFFSETTQCWGFLLQCQLYFTFLGHYLIRLHNSCAPVLTTGA